MFQMTITAVVAGVAKNIGGTAKTRVMEGNTEN